MLTAIVLINADVDKIPEVAQAVANIDGVDTVFSVTGDIDLIALVKVGRHDDLAMVVSDRIGKVDGVQRMKTHIAFREFSSAELREAFEIGLS